MLGLNLGIWNPAIFGRPPQMGGWTRPSDWLALPTLTASDQRFVGLFAVGDHSSNFCALTVTGTGSYVVDWGDGTAPGTIASGVTAYHNYSYAALAGTECSRGYRQAIVSVTMASGNMTGVNLNVKHSQAGLPNGYCVPWLDAAIAGQNITSLAIGGTNVTLGLLEQISIVSTGAITDASWMFYSCASLQSLVMCAGFGSAITNSSFMMYSCSALTSISFPLGFGGSITYAAYMFYGCTSLLIVTFPEGCGALISNAVSLLQSCRAMSHLVLPSGFGSVITDASSILDGCTSLLEISGLTITTTAPTTTGMFPSSIRKASVSIKNSFTINACMGATELDALYTALPDIDGLGYTITVSNNYGYATSDISILTEKGWAPA